MLADYRVLVNNKHGHEPPDRTKDILGIWIDQSEGSKFWLRMKNEIKNRGHFPNDDAAVKLLYFALRNITKDWKMSVKEWKSAMNQFAILFADRFMPQLQ